jgi:15-cis-phytoene synthase
MPVPLSDDVSPAAAAAAGQADTACDLRALRELMRGGSKTFFAASLLLPSRVRAPATALYAYCRLADDAIDLGADPHAEVAGLRQRLNAIYQGHPGIDAADRALCQVVHRFAVPRELLDALLEGFLWDAEGRRYETLSDVQDYAARVAGTVGAMMSLVMDTRGCGALARACELGVAMQLTNIARDVGEDARNGRLYLPREWLRSEGIDPDAWLRQPTFSPALARCIRRLLDAAGQLYRQAEQAVAELPLDCRPAIQAAGRVYAEIGHQLQRRGLDSVNQRAVVSGRRKVALIAWASGAALLPAAHDLVDAEALPAVRFLVEAVRQADLQASPRPVRSTRRSFDERMEWATDLYARLEMQDRRATR